MRIAVASGALEGKRYVTAGRQKRLANFLGRAHDYLAPLGAKAMKALKRITYQKLHELEALIKEREADAAVLPPGRKRPKRPMDAGPRVGKRPMTDLH